LSQFDVTSAAKAAESRTASMTTNVMPALMNFIGNSSKVKQRMHLDPNAGKNSTTSIDGSGRPTYINRV
jgi:hypothetical protein